MSIMQCITVYTNRYETFSDIYEEVLSTTFSENEEKEIGGVVISESGGVPEDYIEKMKAKPEVAVMKIKDRGVTILQHGEVFEMLIPVEK
jgi:Mg2+/Co2+ transporter CorC